ncbi:hypothetical protein J7K07_03255 [Candidatus Bathyarchaeota archaeon]|nr:hypothetical protein [Candidatus Bathyarchaeota archaeon]
MTRLRRIVVKPKPIKPREAGFRCFSPYRTLTFTLRICLMKDSLLINVIVRERPD